MDRKRSNDLARLRNNPDQKGYEVGFGKPPEHTRFKLGQSGNPKGRPKGSRNKIPALIEERLKKIILEEAYYSITVNDGDRILTLPMAQAVVRITFRARKKDCDDGIAHLQGLLDKNPDYPHRQSYLDEVECERHVRQILCKLIPDE